MLTKPALSADQICQTLKEFGFDFYSGVPCSYFKHVIIQAEGDPALTYIDASNEGAALAICAGASLAGAKTACMLQNSGFGNLINPLTSLSMIYSIPCLLMISLRAFPDGVEDEPQHRIIGSTLPTLLETLGIPYRFMPTESGQFHDEIAALNDIVEQGRCAVLLIPKDSISAGTYQAVTPPAQWPLTRLEAIRAVAESTPEDAAIVATTGMISRELFSVKDRARNFYMQGSMGHAPAIALGMAARNPERLTIVLDGDGAALMHLGTLATVGHHKPGRFLHIIVDNEAYATTGNQPTASRTVDLHQIALACGYERSARCETVEQIGANMRDMLHAARPSCLTVKVNREVSRGIPRITSAYTPEQTAERFKSGLLHG